jgi:hypothetical protein
MTEHIETYQIGPTDTTKWTEVKFTSYLDQTVVDALKNIKWGSVTINIQNGEIKTIEKKETFKVGGEK